MIRRLFLLLGTRRRKLRSFVNLCHQSSHLVIVSFLRSTFLLLALAMRAIVFSSPIVIPVYLLLIRTGACSIVLSPLELPVAVQLFFDHEKLRLNSGQHLSPSNSDLKTSSVLLPCPGPNKLWGPQAVPLPSVLVQLINRTRPSSNPVSSGTHSWRR